MNVNQFGDNPYESPVVQAELVRPVQQPKRWTPYFSFLMTLVGPFAFLMFSRYAKLTWHLYPHNGPVDLTLAFTVLAIWLVSLCRSLWWLVAHSWR